MPYEPTRLSAEAFDELRTITRAEIKEPMTDDEVEEMGIRLLRLFSILSVLEPNPDKIMVSDHDQKALTYLSGEIQSGRNPSVRDLARAMGLRSSRSGFRLMKKYFEKGWVWRDEEGALRVRGSVI